MKYLLPSILFLASCTSPEFVTLKTKTGEHIHTVSENSFFNTPDKASEWAFWYFPVVIFVVCKLLTVPLVKSIFDDVILLVLIFDVVIFII